MKFICGYCGGTKRGRVSPPKQFTTWEDLIDHLINFHRYRSMDNKLVRR